MWQRLRFSHSIQFMTPCYSDTGDIWKLCISHTGEQTQWRGKDTFVFNFVNFDLWTAIYPAHWTILNYYLPIQSVYYLTTYVCLGLPANIAVAASGLNSSSLTISGQTLSFCALGGGRASPADGEKAGWTGMTHQVMILTWVITANLHVCALFVPSGKT